MRLQIVSDTHLELGAGCPAEVARERGLYIDDTGADAIVLAGDVAAGADGVAWAAARWPDRPVFYVLGNHEFYHRGVQAVLAECHEVATGTSVHVLEREAVTFGGVRFLGTTLWTDFALFGDVAAGQQAAQQLMSDFRVIPDPDTGILQPEQTRQWHSASIAWLAAELELAMPTVVISHHAPHRRSDHFCNMASAGFVSDLPDLLHTYRPTLWVHGHTHGRDDYQVGQTRVVSNQFGYDGEETGFDPSLVIDVPGDLSLATALA